jgi:uncharacterized protein YndB with AHSA1/START domain
MTGEVHLSCSIRASREELWEACSTRSGLECWYADRVTGTVARGSVLRLEWPDLGATVELGVDAVHPGERVLFVNGASQVSLAVFDGRIELSHAGLESDDDVQGFQSSWRVALSLLKHSLEEHPGSPRRIRWAARSVKASPELVHLCFTSPAALDKWVGRGSRMGGEGDAYALTLPSGERISGKVLSRSEGRDVALSWDEQNDSVLIFRTLPSPRIDEERVAAICWSKWGATEPGERALERQLNEALERLGAMLAMSGRA